ncbi:50S ribosomal protein L32 [Candidatus Haliotispira prima]|uniref:Large ribosomal subunit protein bL32 n=1 Tax=Candidatus Haliotispira prima TaxID=3034016 RepID=A0ABY8MIH5_9SPIO|nr:50S ribosomal protein L32 [Candidatus Haliotispira prima]
MAVPKHKPSKSRSRRRRAVNNRVTVVNRIECKSCGNSKLLHRVCPACGYYRGRQVLDVE